mgnify:CR=1 FL=1
MAEAIVERWGVVHERELAAGGVLALERWEELELVELRRDDGVWYPVGLEGLGHLSPRIAVTLVALHRGWSIVEVCDPARVDATLRAALYGDAAEVRRCAVRGDATEVAALCGRVAMFLSRASARAWLELLAHWTAVGTLGEPGEELRSELARVLGEGEG